MEIGSKAPDFTLKGIDKDGEEKEYTLSDYEGENVILFFYPKDDTPACTIEASDFNDNLPHLNQITKVFGISADDTENHKAFKDKYGLDIILLSDPDGEVMESYGVINDTDPEQIMAKRTTFLIDKEGNIKKIWENIAVDGHVEEVMKALKDL